MLSSIDFELEVYEYGKLDLNSNDGGISFDIKSILNDSDDRL